MDGFTHREYTWEELERARNGIDPTAFLTALTRVLHEEHAGRREENYYYGEMLRGIRGVIKFKVTDLVMLTSSGTKPPTLGYLVPATSPLPLGCQSIKVTLSGDRSTGDCLRLTAGLLPADFSQEFNHAVFTKQTLKMNWLKAVWSVADFPDSFQGIKGNAFVPTATLDPKDLDPTYKQRLAIMLYWPHWQQMRVTDEAKIADLKESGLQAPESKGAMWTTLSRMTLFSRPVNSLGDGPG